VKKCWVKKILTLKLQKSNSDKNVRLFNIEITGEDKGVSGYKNPPINIWGTIFNSGRPQ